MNIIPTTYAIFWSLPGGRQQFHADGYRYPKKHGYDDSLDDVGDVVARFRSSFPNDVIHSVRDRRGRFLPFKETNRARHHDQQEAP